MCSRGASFGRTHFAPRKSKFDEFPNRLRPGFFMASLDVWIFGSRFCAFDGPPVDTSQCFEISGLHRTKIKERFRLGLLDLTIEQHLVPRVEPLVNSNRCYCGGLFR